MSHYRDHDEEIADLRREFAPRKPTYTQCPDRMCGADDCPNCHPENFEEHGHLLPDPEPLEGLRTDE